MITPGLLRRSLVRAFQWRLLLLQLFLVALPAWVAVQPIADFFQTQLSHWPHAKEVAGTMSGSVLFELLLQLEGPASNGLGAGFTPAFLLALLFGPLFAGAVIAVSRSDEPLRSRPLLEGAGTYYGRMVRMLFAGLIPLAAASAIIVPLNKWATSAAAKATTEAAENGPARTSMIISIVVVLLAMIWLDAARAQFAARPERRSAFLAVFSGGWMMLRRPLRSILIALGTGLVSLLIAAVFIVLRQHLSQANGGSVMLALVVSQLSLAALAWGRAARLIAFAELARADQLDRARTAPSAFEMAPPKTSPPPVTMPDGAPHWSSPPDVPVTLRDPPKEAVPVTLRDPPALVVPAAPAVPAVIELPPPDESGIAPPGPSNPPAAPGSGTGSSQS